MIPGPQLLQASSCGDCVFLGSAPHKGVMADIYYCRYSEEIMARVNDNWVDEAVRKDHIHQTPDHYALAIGYDWARARGLF